jgi:hypothetical protein
MADPREYNPDVVAVTEKSGRQDYDKNTGWIPA